MGGRGWGKYADGLLEREEESKCRGSFQGCTTCARERRHGRVPDMVIQKVRPHRMNVSSDWGPDASQMADAQQRGRVSVLHVESAGPSGRGEVSAIFGSKLSVDRRGRSESHWRGDQTAPHSTAEPSYI